MADTREGNGRADEPNLEDTEHGPHVGAVGSVSHAGVMNGVLWATAQRWGVRLTSLLTFVVLGRLLEPREFGLVALASVVVSIVNVFSEVGFSTYVVQARHLDQRTLSTVFWSGSLLSAVLAGGLVLSAEPLTAHLGSPELAMPLSVMSAVILLTALSSTQVALLKRRLAFRAIAARSLVATAVSCACAVGLALSGAGVWALVGQSVIFSLTSVVMLWSVARWRPHRAFDIGLAREVVKYGISILGIALISRLRRSGDALVIGWLAGPLSLGFFVVATRIVEVLLDTATSVVSSVANPVFARLKDDMPRLRAAYVKAVSNSLAVVAPVFFLVAALMPVLLPVLFGSGHLTSASVRLNC